MHGLGEWKTAGLQASAQATDTPEAIESLRHALAGGLSDKSQLCKIKCRPLRSVTALHVIPPGLF